MQILIQEYPYMRNATKTALLHRIKDTETPVTFCYLGHQPSAILGLEPGETDNICVLLKAERNRELWKVDMDMRLGRGYNPTKTTENPVVFKKRKESEVSPGEPVVVYETVR